MFTSTLKTQDYREWQSRINENRSKKNAFSNNNLLKTAADYFSVQCFMLELQYPLEFGILLSSYQLSICNSLLV